MSRGRPAVYTGPLADSIVSLIREKGLTGAQRELAKVGLPVDGKPRRKHYKVCLPTLAKLAEGAGITLQRGRRTAA